MAVEGKFNIDVCKFLALHKIGLLILSHIFGVEGTLKPCQDKPFSPSTNYLKQHKYKYFWKLIGLNS